MSEQNNTNATIDPSAMSDEAAMLARSEDGQEQAAEQTQPQAQAEETFDPAIKAVLDEIMKLLDQAHKLAASVPPATNDAGNKIGRIAVICAVMMESDSLRSFRSASCVQGNGNQIIDLIGVGAQFPELKVRIAMKLLSR